jgi:hypothetical protein
MDDRCDRKSIWQMMLAPDYVEKVLRDCKGLSIDAIWWAARGSPEFNGDLEKAKEGFFWLAQHFIERGELKIGQNGVPFEGSPSEQLQQFRLMWPARFDDSDPRLAMDLWWYFVPADAIWIYPNHVRLS